MAELSIREESFEDVVVLHMRGHIRIGESSITVRRAVRGLLEKGQKKFVFDLAGVSYVDSCGHGEIVVSHTTIEKEGGKTAFCHVSRKIQNLWKITTMLTFLDVYDDVAGAVAALSMHRKLFRCPVPGCKWRVAVLQSPESTISPICAACGTRFEMTLSATDSSEGTIRSLNMPTYQDESYQDEYIRTIFGSPNLIEINGRLDLFACDTLRKAWQTIPPPRRVMFDISQATEISQRGREVLQELCLSDDVDAMAVVLSEFSQPSDFLETSVRVYDNREDALAAFERSEKEEPLIAHLLPDTTG